MKTPLILFAVALLTRAAVAADDLDGLIAQAMRDNREVAAAEQKWEAMKQRSGEVRSLPDIMAGVTAERAGSTQFNDYEDLAYMVQQDLPGWGKRSTRVRMAQLEAESAGFAYLEARRAARRDVIRAYWDLWLAGQTVSVMTQSRDVMQQMAQSALVRYESGRAPQSEVLRAQIEFARMSNDVVTMEHETDVARTALNAVLNAPAHTPRTVVELPALPDFDASLSVMLSKARRFCCILLREQRAVDVKNAALRAARIDHRPDFQVRVEARQFKESGSIDEYDTGVSLNVPWLWHGKYGAAVREAKADLSMAEADYDRAVSETNLKIQELHTTTETALRVMNINLDSQLPRAEQLISSVRSGYQTGQASLLEVLDAQRTLQDLELATYRATADFAKSYAELDAITAPWAPDELATGLIPPVADPEPTP